MKIKKLTAKEQRFCKRYLIDFNATKAAMEIGYSKRSARVTGCRLLTKANVQEHIDKLRKEMDGKFNVTLERLLQELSYVAFSDVTRLFSKDGTLKALHLLTEEERAAISSVEVDEIAEYVKGEKKVLGQTKKVKAWDKLKAIEMIAKLQGHLSTLKISGTDDKGKPIKEFKVTLNL